jgi:prepilin-type N-terminal cleavage/methylation domain-containing protein
MSNKLKELRAKEGFTIIEVIIVLVIGAVIMLAVFLVVPQLQRTQRNSARQNAARRVLTAGEQYASTNSGSYPSCTAGEFLSPTSNGTSPTLCTNITNITGDINSPAGKGYKIVAAANPGLDEMSITNNSSTATCLSSTGGTFATSGTAANGKFIVAIAQENNTTTPTYWCLTN